MIIYTGAFSFPDGDAGAARVLGIGRALRSAGYQVEFAGWEEHEREVDRLGNNFVYDGFCYKSQSDLRHQKLSPIKRLIRYVFAGGNTMKWLNSKDTTGVFAIIAYHGGSLFLLRLALFCKSRGIKLVVDVTEWYDPKYLVGGRFGLVRIDNDIRMRLINSCIGWIIPISSYLENYYSKKGCHVLRIPPLVDLSDSKWPVSPKVESSTQRNLRLVYAGTPGKKDLLGNAIRGLVFLRGEGLIIDLHLIGPTRQDIAACLGGDISDLDLLGDSVIFHGRVPQSEVPCLLASNDFSILLRPLERYAQAGFPTKLVESLSAGVPVIANPTSDIKEFVQDGREGILLTDHSPAAFVAGVKRALVLSNDQKDIMRRNARLRAEISFDYRVFVQQISAFMQEFK